MACHTASGSKAWSDAIFCARRPHSGVNSQMQGVEVLPAHILGPPFSHASGFSNPGAPGPSCPDTDGMHPASVSGSGLLHGVYRY
jgi:hypothetical protein